MAYMTRIRRNPGSTIVTDYECPVHGRFEATVALGEDGDPPATYVCTAPAELCDLPDMFCGEDAEWRPSAPGAVRIKAGEVVRGKSVERPADRYVMNTEKLADGMPLDEWKKERAAVHRDESLRRVRDAMGRTGKVWR